jgi:hypothetical protein
MISFFKPSIDQKQFSKKETERADSRLPRNNDTATCPNPAWEDFSWGTKIDTFLQIFTGQQLTLAKALQVRPHRLSARDIREVQRVRVIAAVVRDHNFHFDLLWLLLVCWEVVRIRWKREE